MKRAWWLLLVSASLSAQTEIKHFHRIDDRVYAGREPSKEQFAELAHMGIKTILDLRGGAIHEPHERKLVEGLGMKYTSVRLSGIWEPRAKQMAEILALLQNPADTPVYLHCRRGDDRVGMVVACYRIAHDHWTNQAALQEARHDGLNPLEILMKRYIRHFTPPTATGELKSGPSSLP